METTGYNLWIIYDLYGTLSPESGESHGKEKRNRHGSWDCIVVCKDLWVFVFRIIIRVGTT